MSKKILSIFVLILTLSFSTQAFASLTFTTNAITGTSASSIDLGSGNDLNLQTIGRNVSIGTATTLGSKLSIDASGSNTTPLIIKTNGSVGNYTQTNSGIFVKNAAGDEIFRIYAGDPDHLNNYNGGNLYVGLNAGAAQPSDNVSAGYYNTGVGVNALSSVTTGASNTAFGAQSLKITTGNANTAIGVSSLLAQVTGDGNTALGSYSGTGVTTSGYNTFLGSFAGYRSGTLPNGTINNAVTTGSFNTFVGRQAGFNSATQRTNTTVLGYGAVVDADNTVVLGNVNVTDILAGSTALAKVKAGSIQLTTGVKPTCDAAARGTTWYVAGGAGVADTIEICGKAAADTYSWIALGTF